MSNSPLIVSVEAMQWVDLVTVQGRVDSETAPQLDEKLKELLANGRYQIVINLSQVSYISSAGLRILVSALRACKNNGGDMRLAAPSARVAEVLDLVGLTELFQIFDDDLTAVGSF